MCLYNIGKKEIAKHDIECYKWVRIEYHYDSLKDHHGDSFVCKINGIKVEGVISIEGYSVFLCQNVRDGMRCSNKFGYYYSWAIDSAVGDLVINGIQIPFTLVTPYKNAIVKIGQTYFSEIDVQGDSIEKALHSFLKLDAAESDCGDHSAIIKCVIPKGSVYYKGEFCSYASYASDTLRYEEIVW